MKRVEFAGNSLASLRDFPEAIRKEIGVQLHKLQLGLSPTDWRPMPVIGSGVREIRVRDSQGAFRVIYISALADVVYVLHAFQKKTQKTASKDLNIAALRLQRLLEIK
ncbi:type II toxin-antitoxin system RelE/ParE family toxin [Phyllobacterium sp. NPDC097923]|uniref:type II toxin-antitoxin system RelE/ParE family toxin n=1 Tax=Phyllobacterium sp. NPDC097923 TaxID=3364404 RepID=UPI00383BB8D1